MKVVSTKSPSAFLRTRGLSLIEVVVTLGIFSILATFLFVAVQEVTNQWKTGERRRALYEKAAAVIDIMADDIRLAYTREQPGAQEVKCKFICLPEESHENAWHQQLMFVRTFEAGPERAILHNAGDGRPGTIQLKAPNEEGGNDEFDSRLIDAQDYTGSANGDFRAPGGTAMVAYFSRNQTLYRAIRAPVDGRFGSLLTEEAGQPIATDVLYLAFEFWGQRTESWTLDPSEKDKTLGPQRIWDSTRGYSNGPLRNFYLHRGKDSLNDPEDDVFPRKVRVTVTVDSPMPRCVHTRLVEDLGETDMEFDVDSAKGFPDPEESDTYIIIDEEWMLLGRSKNDHFQLKKRGQRSTFAREHKAGAIIRVGRTFDRVIFVPGWREDFTTDDVYAARKKEKAEALKPKRLTQ